MTNFKVTENSYFAGYSQERSEFYQFKNKQSMFNTVIAALFTGLILMFLNVDEVQSPEFYKFLYWSLSCLSLFSIIAFKLIDKDIKRLRKERIEAAFKKVEKSGKNLNIESNKLLKAVAAFLLEKKVYSRYHEELIDSMKSKSEVSVDDVLSLMPIIERMEKEENKASKI